MAGLDKMLLTYPPLVLHDLWPCSAAAWGIGQYREFSDHVAVSTVVSGAPVVPRPRRPCVSLWAARLPAFTIEVGRIVEQVGGLDVERGSRARRVLPSS